MCEDCQRRYEENPLRILDCKVDLCQPSINDSPGSADHLCSDCEDHFAQVRQFLEALGLSYEIDSRLVRGLDYYTRTVFELVSKDLGAQDALLGGGRYDDLAEMLGGPPTPGIGFAGGMERLILVLRERTPVLQGRERLDLFFVTLGEAGRGLAVDLAKKLRQQGISVDLDYRARALRKQMSYADQLGVRYLLVFGNDEVATKKGKLKEMDSGQEREVTLTPEDISAAINGR